MEKNVTLFAIGPVCTTYEIEIGKNKFGEPIKIRYWQVNGPTKAEWYYMCHGLTFSGGGPFSFSPYSGTSVKKILDVFYKDISAKDAQAGDIVVFKNAAGSPIHTCVIITPMFKQNGDLDPDNTMVKSKNGPENPEVVTTLKAVIAVPAYAGRWRVYTRK